MQAQEQLLRAAPIAGTARSTPHDLLFTQSLVDAITKILVHP